jgi:hypothetical protein
MISSSIFANLPFDIIREILLYDTHYVIQNKKLICINRIPETDFRFNLYSNNIPKIFKQTHNSWVVIMGQNKKYVLWHHLKPNLLWEYAYAVFCKDRHTNMLSTIPEYEFIF